MKAVCVDDEAIMLEGIVAMCEKIKDFQSVKGFEKPELALEYIKCNDVDVAFLDIDMPVLGGIELGKKIKEVKPKVNIVFVTGYDQYAMDAFKMHASGYLLKPASYDDIRAEVNNIIESRGGEKKEENVANLDETQGIRIVAFGNFEVYIDGKPAEFQRSKTKELMAYLVDRQGANCTNGELEAVLWEDDDDHSSYLKKIRTDLINTFKKAGYENIIDKKWGSVGINTDAVWCDYFEWRKGSAHGVMAFNGEYMSQYSWAEGTLGMLNQINMSLKKEK